MWDGEVVWEEPPSGVWGRYFRELRRHPFRWAVWPGHPNMAYHIRRGSLKGIEPGEFEATQEDGRVYVRYLGERNPDE